MAFVDAHEVIAAPISDRHIASYISFSRAKEMQTIRILQPFSLFLFRQCAPRGPSVLKQELRGQSRAEQAANATIQHIDEAAGCENSSGRYDFMNADFMCASWFPLA